MPKLFRLLISLVCLGLLRSQALAVTPTETLSATVTPTISVTPTVTLTAVCGSTFGCQACTPGVGAGALSSYFIASRFSLPSEGTINGLCVYFTGTSGGWVEMGLYSEESGRPGTLLVKAAESTTAEGWNEFQIFPTYFPAGSYWIASLSEPHRVFWDNISMPASSLGMETSFAYGPLPLSAPVDVVGTNRSYLMYASYCPGPPLFFTPTPTVTPTPAYLRSADPSKVLLGPVPAREGQPICLYFNAAPESSDWQVYNAAGERVAALNYGAEARQCWDTTAVAAGIYFAKIDYKAGGEAKTLTQKVVVLR